MTNKTSALVIVAVLVAVQLFDVAIHVGTGQAEPVRILSNVIIGLWALWSVLGTATAKSGLIAIIAYLGLNAIFVAMHGFTNPDQGGAVRMMLFVLVGVSALLAFWLRTKVRQD